MKGLFHPNYRLPWSVLERFLQTAPSCLELYPFTVCATSTDLQMACQACSHIFHKLQGSTVVLVGAYTYLDERMIKNLAKKHCFTVSFTYAEVILTSNDIKKMMKKLCANNEEGEKNHKPKSSR